MEEASTVMRPEIESRNHYMNLIANYFFFFFLPLTFLFFLFRCFRCVPVASPDAIEPANSLEAAPKSGMVLSVAALAEALAATGRAGAYGMFVRGITSSVDGWVGCV